MNQIPDIPDRPWHPDPDDEWEWECTSQDDKRHSISNYWCRV